MRIWISLIVLGFAGCDNVLYPGPCTASRTDFECTYSYENGLPASATCHEDHPIEPGTFEATWTYDGDVLVGFHLISDYRASYRHDITWDLDASPPTRHEKGDDGGVFSWVYDDELEAEGLFLVGQQFDLKEVLATEDRRTRWHTVNTNSDNNMTIVGDVTYTYDPATIPTDGTRVRTDSDGQTFEFRYEGGHLVAGESYDYTWSGDRLTQLVRTVNGWVIDYEYDDAGNLTSSHLSNHSNPSVATTYGYACW